MKHQVITFIALFGIAVTGCISSTDPHKKAKQGAGIGAAAGAVVGAVVGHQSGNRNTGAVVGAAVGAGVGTAVGHRMDKQQAELERVQGIEVARIADDEIVDPRSRSEVRERESPGVRPSPQAKNGSPFGLRETWRQT